MKKIYIINILILSLFVISCTLKSGGGSGGDSGGGGISGPVIEAVETSTSGTNGAASGSGTIVLTISENLKAIDKTKFVVKHGTADPPTNAATVSQAFFYGKKAYLTINKTIATGDFVSVALLADAFTVDTASSEKNQANATPVVSAAAADKAPELLAVYPTIAGGVGFVFDKLLDTTYTFAQANFKVSVGASAATAVVPANPVIGKATITASKFASTLFDASTGVTDDDFVNYVVERSSGLVTDHVYPYIGGGDTFNVDLLANAVQDTKGVKSAAKTGFTMTYTDEVAPQLLDTNYLYNPKGKTVVVLFNEEIKTIDISKITLKTGATTANTVNTVTEAWSSPGAGHISGGGFGTYNSVHLTLTTDITSASEKMRIEFEAGAFVGKDSNLPVAAYASASDVVNGLTGTDAGPQIVKLEIPAAGDIVYVYFNEYLHKHGAGIGYSAGITIQQRKNTGGWANVRDAKFGYDPALSLTHGRYIIRIQLPAALASGDVAGIKFNIGGLVWDFRGQQNLGLGRNSQGVYARTP